MRILLFFDLPTLTLEDKKNYRHFVKDVIRLGFYRIQESVFVKMCLNQQASESTINSIDLIKPKSGSIMLLTVTEKQFAKMKILLGEINSDVVSSDERVITL